jgi:hypothetical protein|tara:strand:+ start:7839 stop:8159 length:321 start_codon:yes stop_codon:yes gene_type:complete
VKVSIGTIEINDAERRAIRTYLDAQEERERPRTTPASREEIKRFVDQAISYAFNEVTADDAAQDYELPDEYTPASNPAEHHVDYCQDPNCHDHGAGVMPWLWSEAG